MPRITAEPMVTHCTGQSGLLSGIKKCQFTFGSYTAAAATPQIRYEMQDFTDNNSTFGTVTGFKALLFEFKRGIHAEVHFRIGHEISLQPIGTIQIQWVDPNDYEQKESSKKAIVCDAYARMVFQAVAVPWGQEPIPMCAPNIFVGRTAREDNTIDNQATQFSN